MKSEVEIVEKVRFLVRAELDARMASFEVKLPHKCHHNHRQPLDHRRYVEGERNPTYNRVTTKEGYAVEQTIGLCMLNTTSEEWKGTVCEDPIDAQGCPYYDPIESRRDVYTSFLVNVGDPFWRQEHMPELHALLWVLGVNVVHMSYPTWWDRFLALFRPPPLLLPEGQYACIDAYVPTFEDYENDRIRKAPDNRESPKES